MPLALGEAVLRAPHDLSARCQWLPTTTRYVLASDANVGPSQASNNGADPRARAVVLPLADKAA